jgi:L-lactate dehydrogenase complex protein LldG
MTDAARERLFGKIRKATAGGSGEAARRTEVEAHLAGHARGVVPARAMVSGGEAIVPFVARLKAASISVAEAAHLSDVPRLAAEFLRANNLPARLRMGNDPDLSALDWAAAAPLEVLTGRAQPRDEVSLAKAFAGIAETGTLVLTSGPANPTTLNFLPETEIVVVRAADVVGGYEDAWDKLRATFGAAMPRTVNWVSGPSRTADIEQTIVMGAHGPRRLHVILSG